MARKPYQPQPWIREAIIEEQRRRYAALVHGCDVMATRHGSPNRADEYRREAESVATRLAEGDVVLAAEDLWLALHHAHADELATQVLQLGRQHGRPGRPVCFRLDAGEELHLDLEYAESGA